MKKYIEIEEELLDKLSNISNEEEDFTLNIVDKDGGYVDSIFCGIRHMFVNDWVVIGNDVSDNINGNDLLFVDPENVKKYRDDIEEFISQYGFKNTNDNYYVIEDIN